VSVGDGGAKGSTDDGQPLLELLARTGPKRGSTIAVTVGGCTMGRANDNTLCIPDKELSRKHSKVGFSPASQGGGQFFVSDMGSTNGTYVQLVGPYAGKYPLHLNDHILVSTTSLVRR
jgi:pSer/pThr/pTyr-binding forkhead associated (FHA) protein